MCREASALDRIAIALEKVATDLPTLTLLVEKLAGYEEKLVKLQEQHVSNSERMALQQIQFLELRTKEYALFQERELREKESSKLFNRIQEERLAREKGYTKLFTGKEQDNVTEGSSKESEKGEQV